MKLELLDFPGVEFTEKDLNAIGVLYFKLDKNEWQKQIEKICQERGYKNRDEVFISTGDKGAESRTFYTTNQIKLTKDNEKLPGMLKKFFEEHSHDDEEIRFVVGGSGRFDLRDDQDRWVGVTVEEGDLIIVPANMHHRFGLGDNSDWIHAMRLFTDAPKWEAIPRATPPAAK
eukprot:TRINITY_DN28023_c0_g1_i1.p1 TRINITY_DN28023_c0_g1~~TRINITY_DN28023_c0_g1_i1.p1  ORF type:complete len:190 (-),score=56.13 TRINITY_DN28023_c0_g1_i1:40-558(-)